MTTKELERTAINEVHAANHGGVGFCIKNVYTNVMDGMLVEVQFDTREGVHAINHVYFGRSRCDVYRSFHEVCSALATYREPSVFFRLLGVTGVGGLIALILIIVFSVLMSFLALTNSTPNQSIIEVIKLSFAIILGYFFGSQRNRKDD